MAGGERSVKIKFTGAVDKSLNRAAKSAEKSVKKFGDKVSGALSNVTDKLPGILSGAIGALPPQGQALALVLVAGLAVSLSAMIGAAITSAVLLAVGGGVLVAGIKAASSNPRVKAAFGELKKTAQAIWKDLGKPFIDPLVRAARTFNKTLKETVGPAVTRMGKLLAPVIDKLAPALDKFFKNAMPGIEKAVTASVPLFETLAEKLPLIGDAISIFFEEISKNGDDANDFFGELLTVIAGLIIMLGQAIGKLTEWYGDIKDGLEDAKEWFAGFKVAALMHLGKLLAGAVIALGWIPGIGPKLKDAQDKFREFQQNANAELNKIRDRRIKIEVWSNVASVAADVAERLANLGGRRIGARAAGGPVSAGRSYLVGEKGPEIVTMGGNGHVTPNHQLAGGGGSQVIELVVDLGEGIRQVFRGEIRQHDRTLKRQTLQMRGA